MQKPECKVICLKLGWPKWARLGRIKLTIVADDTFKSRVFISSLFESLILFLLN